MESGREMYWTGEGVPASTVRPCSVSLLVSCPQGQRADLRLVRTSSAQRDGSGDVDAGHCMSMGISMGMSMSMDTSMGMSISMGMSMCMFWMLKHRLRPGHSHGRCQGEQAGSQFTVP
jgi:hypothetical protein